MANTIGTDVRRALTLVSRATHAAWTPAKIAAEVGVNVRSVYYWRAGQHQPNARNRAALKVLISGLRHQASSGPYGMTATEKVLVDALDALRTDAERARLVQVNAELEASAAQAEADVEAALEARYQARQSRRIARQRTSVSAYASVDPFVLAGAKPEPALPF